MSNGDKIKNAVSALAYGVILVLQGVNIAETGGQTELIKRTDIAIEKQTELIKQVNQEGERVNAGLHNQIVMLERMDGLLKNQSELIVNQEQMIQSMKNKLPQ